MLLVTKPGGRLVVQGLATEISRSGWRSVKWRNLAGGIVALHSAIRAA